jgi:hypothetical protein
MWCWGSPKTTIKKSVLADSLVFLPVGAYYNLLEISGELVLESCNPLLYIGSSTACIDDSDCVSLGKPTL